MSLRCPECGHETVISVRFCPSCGGKMPAQEAPPEGKVEPEPAPTAQPAQPEPAEQPEPQPQPSAKPQPIPPSPASSIITIPSAIGQSVPPPAQPLADRPAEQPPAAATAPQPPPPARAEPSAAPPPAPTPPPAVPPAAAQPPPKKKSNAWLWACGGCGCLALLVAAILGTLLFMGVRKEVREAHETSTSQGAAQPSEATSSAEEVATDHYEVTVPSGWSRDSDPEDETLTVSGPEVNGEQLSLLIRVEELSEGVSLKQFSDQVLEPYRNASWTEDTTEASLCQEPARRVALTTDDHDYLIYISVYKARGFVIVMIAPEGTMEEQESTFDQVLNEFAMYE